MVQITFGCHPEDLEQAQWDLIHQVQQALFHRSPCGVVCQQLQNALPQHPASPQAWAQAFSQALLALLDQNERAQQERSALQERCALLETYCRRYQEHPLQAQVAALRSSQAHWQQVAEAQTAHAEQLQQDLSATQAALQREITRLEGEISQLNAILVQQQEALRARS